MKFPAALENIVTKPMYRQKIKNKNALLHFGMPSKAPCVEKTRVKLCLAVNLSNRSHVASYRLYLEDRCHVRRRIPACETAGGLEGHMCAPVSLTVAFTTLLHSIIELKLHLLSHIVSWQQLVLRNSSCTEPTLRPRRFIRHSVLPVCCFGLQGVSIGRLVAFL